MTYNPFSLAGKTILVTGASSGIGKAIATECSKLGATLIINGRNEERLRQTLDGLEGGGHVSVAGDVTDEAFVKSMVDGLPEIDGAVLCAGMDLSVPVQFCDRKRMDQVFDLNFFSTVEMTRLVYRKKKLIKGGSIVLMDSVSGVSCFSNGRAIYGSTKAALSAFSKFCALEFSGRKIRVNCICPGMIETPFIHGHEFSEEQLAEDAKKYPCGRYGMPYDVAMGAVYLLSDASSWVTGTNLYIDGGISLV